MITWERELEVTATRGDLVVLGTGGAGGSQVGDEQVAGGVVEVSSFDGDVDAGADVALVCPSTYASHPTDPLPNASPNRKLAPRRCLDQHQHDRQLHHQRPAPARVGTGARRG